MLNKDASAWTPNVRPDIPSPLARTSANWPSTGPSTACSITMGVGPQASAPVVVAEVGEEVVTCMVEVSSEAVVVLVRRSVIVIVTSVVVADETEGGLSVDVAEISSPPVVVADGRSEVVIPKEGIASIVEVIELILRVGDINSVVFKDGMPVSKVSAAVVSAAVVSVVVVSVVVVSVFKVIVVKVSVVLGSMVVGSTTVVLGTTGGVVIGSLFVDIVDVD